VVSLHTVCFFLFQRKGEEENFGVSRCDKTTQQKSISLNEVFFTGSVKWGGKRKYDIIPAYSRAYQILRWTGIYRFCIIAAMNEIYRVFCDNSDSFLTVILSTAILFSR